jgi:flagellar basal body rod protein FlgG
MQIGLYQSAASLSALERWQDAVSQNISSSQVSGYRKRTVEFATTNDGQIRSDTRAGESIAAQFPTTSVGINFQKGELQATRRELDAGLQTDGFFEVQREDGTKAYTRNGEFHIRPDRTLVTGDGMAVLSTGGNPITLLPEGGTVTINQDGTIVQGSTALGKLSVVDFPEVGALMPAGGGLFTAVNGATGEPVQDAVVLQGHLEGSNVVPLREMVDLVLISRAYEASQRVTSTLDQQIEKTLNALG